MGTTPERNGLSDLLPSVTSAESRVVHCTDSNTGRAFLGAFSGTRLTGLSILRLSDNDIIALTTEDRRAMVIVAEKDTFIAVELHDQDPNKRGNLAFREDISHRRLHLPLSFAAGQDVTYQDQSFVRGEVIPVDPTAEFSKLLFDREAIFEASQPTWYTEDRVTVRLADGRGIVIRADRNKIQGAIAVKPGGIDYMNIRDNKVDTLRLDDLTRSSIPSKFLPSSKGQ